MKRHVLTIFARPLLRYEKTCTRHFCRTRFGRHPSKCRALGAAIHRHGLLSVPSFGGAELTHDTSRTHVRGNERVFGPAQPSHHAARDCGGSAAHGGILRSIDRVSVAAGIQASASGGAGEPTRTGGRRGGANPGEVKVRHAGCSQQGGALVDEGLAVQTSVALAAELRE